MSRQTELPQPWASLTRRHGTGAKLATELGVSYYTLYRWAHGYCAPNDAQQAALNRLFFEAGLPRPTYGNTFGYYRGAR